MSKSGLKKLLAAIAAAALMVTPVTQVVAEVSGNSSSNSSSSAQEVTVSEETEEAGNNGSDDAEDVYIEPYTPYQAAVDTYTANYQTYLAEGRRTENKTVAGVVSNVDGLYYEKNVNGVALTKADGAAAARVVVYDTDLAKSVKASDSINAAVAALNGVEGPTIDIYFTSGTTDAVKTVSVGIPGSFRVDGAVYSAVALVKGGGLYILPDTDSNPNTITISTEGISADQVTLTLVRE